MALAPAYVIVSLRQGPAASPARHLGFDAALKEARGLVRDLEADVAAAERRFRVAEAEIDARRRRQEELEAEVVAIGRREGRLYKFLDERNAAAAKAEAENKKLRAALDGMARILKSLEPVG